MQDIERRIRITIHHQPAVGTGMDALAQLLLDQFTAMGAHLGRVAGVHQDDHSASFCRFADRHTDELRPRLSVERGRRSCRRAPIPPLPKVSGFLGGF